ncbi:ABC transporter permease [Streptomyces sp. NBC_01304]|uniref:ABC transporter permease n=1 Tax=Streptomyces sp. NBC_01304 TaxID=2903818 RepID=UPI002E15570B|nr:ABC transporter permease [Streptomyces sp. NBC_01304]
MAATTTAPAAPKAAPPARTSGFDWRRLLYFGLGGLVLFSLVRSLTGTNDITSVGQVGAAISVAVPILLAGLGGLWSERAGVVNLGLEGMMILGTWFGAWAGYQWGPWTGVIVGIIGGMLGGLLHAIATVTFGVNHIVSGVAINILALGATRFLSKLTFGKLEGGSSTQSPQVDELGSLTVPGLSDALVKLNEKHWFLVSDLAGFLGGLTTDLSWLSVAAIVLLVASFFILWRTAFGLRLRSCGEAPIAAESLGVNVYLYKYVAVIISGALAGLGGVFLSEVAAPFYREGQTVGLGYIGLAAMIFGNWRPAGIAMGALLFGFTGSLKERGAENVMAMFLLLAILLLGVAVWQFTKKKYVQSGLALVAGIAAGVTYLTVDEVPKQFIGAAPYIATLLVLALAAQNLRMPKANGVPYRKGQGK